jgi:hypothetical protein
MKNLDWRLKVPGGDDDDQDNDTIEKPDPPTRPK